MLHDLTNVVLRRLAVGLVLLAWAAASAGEITVSGSGTVWAEPDQATVDLGWSGVEPEVGAAVQRADAAVAAIRAALATLGIEPADVRTTGYAVWREERWDERGEPRLAGYRVTHTLQVVVRDAAALGRVVTAATDAGANQVNGVAYAIADTVALEAEARAAAFAKARERAEQLAALAGVGLGTATSILELGPAAVAPGPYDAAYAPAMGYGGDAVPVTGGRHAVEVVLRVTFATVE